jgi:copper chaperone CopZ
VLIRNNAPVFGANASPYSEPGQWQVTLSTRNLVSNDHYRNGEEQLQRQELQNFVTNRQNLVDLNVSRTITDRFTLSVGIPYVNSSWASRDPRSPLPGPRLEVEQNGRGLGDISVSGRYWLFNTRTHRHWNISAGAGVKMPTGNSEEQDYFVDSRGADPQQRYVDQSVQPGDGGWGVMLEAAGFKRIKRVLLFGSGNYLMNPKNKSDTPSLTLARLPAGTSPSAAQFDRLYNSVPDQYVARLGGTVALFKGFAASVAWRIEGLPRYDLIGASNGFRRPGKAMFVEPGISFSKGNQTFSFNVPMGYYYHRYPDPNTGLEGDATFPRHVFLTSYSLRLARGQKLRPPFRTDQGGTSQPGTPQPGSGDASAIVQEPVLQPGQEFVRLNINGMICEDCAERIRAALLNVKGVADAKVSLEAKQALVIYQSAQLKADDLLEAVKKARGMNQYSAVLQQR